MVCIALIIVCLAILYVLSLRAGNGRTAQMDTFKKQYIAHRGLFNNRDIPENSLSAFAEAVKGGWGIELDVQLTADDKLVVFHDETLDRMCGKEGTLYKMTYSELRKARLLNTDEQIPLLEDVLKLVDGAVPLIVEIKSEGRYIKAARDTNEMLKRYNGDFCIESFHPLVVRWYKKHSPHIIRGQLSTNHTKDGEKGPAIARFALTNMLLNFLSKPDFIAYNHQHKNQFSFRLCSKLYKPVNVAWTIKSREQLENAADMFDVFIFDSFNPKKEG